MATAVLDMRSPKAPTALIVAALIIAAATIAVTLTQHATRHSDAPEIARCLSKNGPAMTFYNPATGRQAHLCETAPGKFGVFISENGQTVTAFGKENLRHWIKNLVRNQGYKLDAASVRADLVDALAAILKELK